MGEDLKKSLKQLKEDFMRECDQLANKCDEIIEAQPLNAFDKLRDCLNDKAEFNKYH